MRDRIKRAIRELSGVMTVSGFEYRATERIRELYGELFDEIYSDRVGNHLLVRRCGKNGAPKIMVDAHLDEIGFVVSEVIEGGFLRIANLGGIDVSILQASDVIIYGESELRGVVASVPPHLRSGKDGELPEMHELLVDVGLGYGYDELCELIPIGTPVGFAPVYSEFGEGRMAGKSFDDKACGAIAALAVADVPTGELAGDVYLCLSAREETSGIGGIYSACFNSRPDYAMVIDVNLGAAPDAPERETVELGKGPSVDYSAATDRALTKMTEGLCTEKEIPYSLCAAPSSTGTNAASVNLVGEGIPVVDIGLPLRNMHTYNEVLCLDDCEALYRLVGEFVRSKKIAERFGGEVAI